MWEFLCAQGQDHVRESRGDSVPQKRAAQIHHPNLSFREEKPSMHRNPVICETNESWLLWQLSPPWLCPGYPGKSRQHFCQWKGCINPIPGRFRDLGTDTPRWSHPPLCISLALPVNFYLKLMSFLLFLFTLWLSSSLVHC